MGQSVENLQQVLRSEDPARNLDGVVAEVPNFAHLQRARRVRRAGIAGAFLVVLAAPIVAMTLMSSRGGVSGTEFALDTSTKGAGASGQAVATGVGSLVLGNSPSEMVMADQNFRSARDGFSFPNWGGAPTSDMIDASTMAALFTKEAVCVDPAAGTCVMLPAAQKVADQMNAAIAAGRCEGMSVLSQRFFDGLDARTDGVIETVKVSQASVMKQVGYWWATQIAPPVSKESKRFRAMTPSAVVAELEKGLQQKMGYTMGLYSIAGGHSVTPIAVTTEGANKLVYIYDNNYPGQIRKIVVDTAKESWTYSDAGLNSGAAKTSWQGTGAGSLDLTPMAVRKGPFKVSFGATRGVKSQAYSVLVTQNDPKGSNVGIRIRARLNGQTIDVNTMDPAQVAAAPFPVKNLVSGSVGRGAIAYVPVVLGDAGKLSLDVVTDESTGPVMMSILRTGTSSIVVESASDFTVELTTQAFSTDAEINFGKNGSGTVQLANGPRAAEIELSKGQNVQFTTKFQDDDAAPDMGTRRIEDPLPEFIVRNAEGKTMFKGSLAGALEPGAAITDVIKFDAKGSAKIVTETVESTDLDMSFVKSLTPTEQPRYDEPTKTPKVTPIPTTEVCDPTNIFSDCYEFKGAAPTPTTTIPEEEESNFDPEFKGTVTTTIAPLVVPPTTPPTPTPTTPPTVLDPITNTVTYNSIRGSQTVSSQTCTAGSTLTLTAPALSDLSTHTFVGWFVGTVKYLPGQQIPCANLALVAEWKLITYPPLSCLKVGTGDEPYYQVGRDYAMVVVKASNTDMIYLNVEEGAVVRAFNFKDISHVILCDLGLEEAGSTDNFLTEFTGTLMNVSFVQCQNRELKSNSDEYWEEWNDQTDRPCSSTTVMISLRGTNLVYDGSSIADALGKIELSSSIQNIDAVCTLNVNDDVVQVVNCTLTGSVSNQTEYLINIDERLLDGQVRISIVKSSDDGDESPSASSTITFNINGGVVTSGDLTQTCTQGKTVDLELPSVERAGYTFDGWFANMNGNQRIDGSLTCEDRTLYAHWKEVAQSMSSLITFNINEGVVTSGDLTQTCTQGETVDLKLPRVERAGYTFDGWSTNKNGSSRVGDSVTCRDLTIYARWI